MSRFLIIIVLFIFSFQYYSQDFTQDYFLHAQNEKEKGDFKEGIEYMKKLFEIDSNKVDYLWLYAELLRLEKNYSLAEYYYKKVYDKEESRIYLRSLFYLAEMKKMNGKYDEALELYKKCKKKYAYDKKEYLYLKSTQEMESCLWLKKAKMDSASVSFNKTLPFNSSESEFAPMINDNKFYFSSLRADSISKSGEIISKNYKSNIYFLEGKDSSTLTLLFETNSLKEHHANITFSLDGKRIYFSSCKENLNEPSCKILMAYLVKDKVLEIDTLDEIVNEADANTSMPYIAHFDDKEVLFFSSNRAGGKGGMDLYYSYIEDEGKKYSMPFPVDKVNSPGNEVTPFYDSIDKKLYFSSDWHFGFGGYDLFCSPFLNYSFQKPENLMLPVNSTNNDLYLVRYNKQYYFSSNRSENNNSTCCSNIYTFKYKEKEIEHQVLATNELRTFKSLEDLNKKLPVTLFFHNDMPNPKSLDTISNVSYMTSYNDYVQLIPKYKKEYSSGLAKEKISDAEEDIESFFIEYVNQGVEDLEVFCKLLLKELENKSSVILTVKGFASPLAKSDYNVNLTKRRISSLVNYLKVYENGIFQKYLFPVHVDSTKLLIQEVPFGEYVAEKWVSDNPNDSKNSIYSRAAALERKIEIQSVNYLTQDTSLLLSAKKQLLNLGSISKNNKLKIAFEVKNIGHLPVEIDSIGVPCKCNSAESTFSILKPNETGIIYLYFDPIDYIGKTVKSIYVYTKNSKTPLRLVITAETN
ncbi:MAG: DUF1573 domain-containing protein [Flavobacteriia bacterium]|nr:DUF1573 domain-containing protein [Flavobacteriia bacterium]